MLTAAGQAFREMFTPPFRAVLFKCVGFTIALLVLLIIAVEWSFSHFVQWPDWIEKAIEWLGGFALMVGSIFLIPPVTSLIASLYLDDIAATVERTNYPGSAWQRAADACRDRARAEFFVVVLLVNIVALFPLLVPGVNLIAFYIGNGYLLGREYFELAAMRHMPPLEAKKLRQANQLTVFLAGLLIAGIASVPILNLITPLFATAFMVHMYKDLARRAGPRIAVRPAARADQ